MKILITGGTGLIGRTLIADLVRCGHSVTVLTRDSQRAALRLPRGVSAYPWDAKTLEGWGHRVAETDAIVNLAGESIAGERLSAILTRRWTPEVKARIRASRVEIGALLSEAIRQADQKPAIFLQASAVGYYGPASEREMEESAPPGDDFLAQVCVAWEDSTASVEALGVRRVILRTGLVLAREGGILPIMLLPVKTFVGGPLGDGKQAVPWIHLADEVAAIRFLLEHEVTQGPYNLSAPHPVTQAEFARVAGRVLGRPTAISTPTLALKLALGEKAALVLEGQRAVPRRLLEAGFGFQFENLEDALRDLA